MQLNILVCQSYMYHICIIYVSYEHEFQVESFDLLPSSDHKSSESHNCLSSVDQVGSLALYVIYYITYESDKGFHALELFWNCYIKLTQNIKFCLSIIHIEGLQLPEISYTPGRNI